eukprot:CAMPEP_0118925684 /NCGR_PEP_ID=MMETSP1169-20130426/3536_1 /TAXON_ID=36882 /ORGANISM="Pyramimonas obovata, Strain CCMP722" /LENGTH=32 /DNA_ID= /DNA_START= /DNA_END= /DNA_ORIENTATION=
MGAMRRGYSSSLSVVNTTAVNTAGQPSTSSSP